ncbi:Ted1p KNAG_0D01790 [Huiozyma naganishii CBS 8797]|uniref:Uncharacterized protein n=1 Tax=Huiozyma naganishii (strain ATCC MYA-139 / BCRC 22969 / CBS 8797 / KCTC 17520 / NBRC 10181 / NCYC 3082 / Yp74L-3) TaxID=1071383 RepID=J7R511_HUIN7|nr:hypothetical protein KNAG_0D01790 [Kazachstania naganishii CBS 8797]CCK69930.1 hypothetical protein KNAG_0D01790 [Kazachstania naganishii CBS 8797]
MLSKQTVRKAAIVSTLLAIVSNVFIFTFPSIHPTRCSWHCSSSSTTGETVAPEALALWEKALFYAKRYVSDVVYQTLQAEEATDEGDIHMMAFGDPQIKGIWPNTPYRSRLDIFGNDHFLGHIYSTMSKRLHPDYVVVMGDLFSSQWIGDSEFYNRTRRYVSRLFHRDTTPLEAIQRENHDEDGLYKVDWDAWGKQFEREAQNNTFQFGFQDIHSWDPQRDEFLMVNLTGNHDVGYSGDATYQHLARFQQIFGKDNYWIEYNAGTDKAWRIVVLNDLLLEGPALQPEFVQYTWEFLYQLFERNFDGSTVLLTHIPFHKEEGLCYDGPELRYYPEVFEREPYKANLLRSQNHISEEVTNKVFNLVFSNDKPGIVLVGHDHEGCEVVYNRFNDQGEWVAAKDTVEGADYHLKEVTVRSMMGEFNGNTGLLTGHFNTNQKQWEWTFTLCPFAIQHAWWFAKAAALVAGFVWSLYIVL